MFINDCGGQQKGKRNFTDIHGETNFFDLLKTCPEDDVLYTSEDIEVKQPSPITMCCESVNDLEDFFLEQQPSHQHHCGT